MSPEDRKMQPAPTQTCKWVEVSKRTILSKNEAKRLKKKPIQTTSKQMSVAEYCKEKDPLGEQSMMLLLYEHAQRLPPGLRHQGDELEWGAKIEKKYTDLGSEIKSPKTRVSKALKEVKRMWKWDYKNEKAVFLCKNSKFMPFQSGTMFFENSSGNMK